MKEKAKEKGIKPSYKRGWWDLMSLFKRDQSRQITIQNMIIKKLDDLEGGQIKLAYLMSELMKLLKEKK